MKAFRRTVTRFTESNANLIYDPKYLRRITRLCRSQTGTIAMGWDKKDKEFGYSRIGLYYIDKKGKPLNFCDIHMYGGETTLLHNVHYGAPSRSAGEAAKERTEREIEKWRETDAVSDAHDLAAGGKGLMYHLKGPRVWYC